MSLQYAHRGGCRWAPRGSVRNAEDALRDEPFLVISGDALTDIDLTGLVPLPQGQGARWSRWRWPRCRTRWEFGHRDHRGETARSSGFLEKPTWGQVFSDTVNTGLYVMEPEVLAGVPAGRGGWTGPPTSSPSCSTAVPRCTATSSDSYWEDVGNPRELPEGPGPTCWAGRVQTDIAGLRGLARRLGRRGRPRSTTDAVLTGPPVRRRLRQDRGRARHLREYNRDRQQRGGQGGRVPAPGRGAQQRLRRPGRHPARLRDRQEHRRGCGWARIEEGAVVGGRGA